MEVFLERRRDRGWEEPPHPVGVYFEHVKGLSDRDGVEYGVVEAQGAGVPDLGRD